MNRILAAFGHVVSILIRRLFTVLCAVALLLVMPSFDGTFTRLAGVHSAIAQENNKGILNFLFKRREPKKIIKKVPKGKGKSVRRSKPTGKKKTVRRLVTPSVPVVEKAENANRVLVIGDFVAGAMGEGLEEAFFENENIAVVLRTNGSSGLVRDDYFDWKVEIAPIIDEVKPSIVVVMLGSNDRQVMRTGGKTEQVRSQVWEKEYIIRVNALVDAIKAQNVPVMWVGSPPFKFRSMSADILSFNELYRQAVESAGGYFIDIWDGFVDEKGNFISAGPDIKGQQVRLRTSDGINFTAAGRRKMAFYAERQLKQLFNNLSSPLSVSLSSQNAPLLTLPPLQTEADLERMDPIAITDPDIDGGSVLLGDIDEETKPGDNPLQVKSVRRRLVEDGLPPPPQPGRAGNFIWSGQAETRLQ